MSDATVDPHRVYDGQDNSKDSDMELADVDKKINQYENALNLLGTDPLLQKEVMLGKRIALYKVGRELGAGNFAKVRAGMHVLCKEKVAIKIIDRAKLDQKALRLLAREIATMDQMHHPNVIQLFEVVETLSKVYIVMEYAGAGDLYTYVLDNEKLEESEASHLFAQAVAAVCHLHENAIIHRDIKAENILGDPKVTHHA